MASAVAKSTPTSIVLEQSIRPASLGHRGTADDPAADLRHPGHTVAARVLWRYGVPDARQGHPVTDEQDGRVGG
jgi:hypothetical protein